MDGLCNYEIYEPNYLLVVESVLFVVDDVSDILEVDVVSIGDTVVESMVVTVVESEVEFVSVVALSLQAAKAPIAKTNNNFFMLFFLML